MKQNTVDVTIKRKTVKLHTISKRGFASSPKTSSQTPLAKSRRNKARNNTPFSNHTFYHLALSKSKTKLKEVKND